MGNIICVIPLADLVRTLQPFEETFAFYPDGIKGVIRDILPLVDGHRVLRFRARKFVSELESASFPVVLDKIMRVYDNSAEAVMAHCTENTYAGPWIELVVEKIWREVQLIMSNMFGSIPVTVSKDEGCWLGNDFVAWVTIHDTYYPSGI
jgi:hypothetical protein